MNQRPGHNRSRVRSPEAIAFARDQRATANEFAHTLWQLLRNRQCRGRKFRREYPIPPYTADFCCPELKPVIEVDGEHHLSEAGRAFDRRRDRWLLDKGFATLRIPGYALLTDVAAVMRRIEETIDTRVAKSTPSPPTPLPRTSSGGEGSRS